MGIEEGSEERPSMRDQIRDAPAAARRAERVGDLSPHESGGVLRGLKDLRRKIAQRRLGY